MSDEKQQSENLTKDESQIKREAYDLGYRHGLEAFAWWSSGRQYVGTTGTALDDAIRDRRTSYNYSPPK